MKNQTDATDFIVGIFILGITVSIMSVTIAMIVYQFREQEARIGAGRPR